MYQTRSEENGIRNLDTLDEAMKQADIDKTIWKISFNSEKGERIRLIRYADPNKWVLESLLTY